tara:strand:+ start:8051 stop:8440 length:390 start_codon:yes stop_codon:yes gene_type:complete
MATHTAANGVVKVGNNAVAEVTGFSIEYNSDTVEDTVIGDTARTYLPTLKMFTATLDVFWDETDTNGQLALDIGTSITFQVFPEGDQTGDLYYTGTGIVTGRSVSTSTGEMITASFTVQGSGDLTETTV